MGTSTTGSPPHLEKKGLKLVEILETFSEKRGVGRLVVMARLRDYVARQPIRDLLEEISFINRDDYLDVLLGVGMRGVLYYAVVKQKAEMMGI